MRSKSREGIDGHSQPWRIVVKGGRPPQLPDFQPQPLRKSSAPSKPPKKTGKWMRSGRLVIKGGLPPELPDYQPRPLRNPSDNESSDSKP